MVTPTPSTPNRTSDFQMSDHSFAGEPPIPAVHLRVYSLQQMQYASHCHCDCQR
eukprot:m.26619 g.26619  ORF g.26619 m.26619 type:complete len:54 (-) comp11813_c0_seq1:76-237(-)